MHMLIWIYIVHEKENLYLFKQTGCNVIMTDMCFRQIKVCVLYSTMSIFIIIHVRHTTVVLNRYIKTVPVFNFEQACL